MGAGEDAVKKAEADFKMLGEALEVLGDQTMRSLYDQGYDKVVFTDSFVVHRGRWCFALRAVSSVTRTHSRYPTSAPATPLILAVLPLLLSVQTAIDERVDASRRAARGEHQHRGHRH